MKNAAFETLAARPKVGVFHFHRKFQTYDVKHWLIGQADVSRELGLVRLLEGAPIAADEFASRQERLKQLRVETIPPILQSGIYNDIDRKSRVFAVSSYVAGSNIDGYVQEVGLPVEQRLRLLLQICSAVRAIHKASLLHLELSPRTILVVHPERVRVVGLGRCLLQQPAPPPTEYVAPELRSNPPYQLITSAADVYSIAKVAALLLQAANHDTYAWRYRWLGISPPRDPRLVPPHSTRIGCGYCAVL